MPRAPKHCGIQGCTTIVPAGTHCEQHQHRWGKGNKRTKDPRHIDWRKAVLARAHGACQIQYPGICQHRATIADHIRAVGLGGAEYDVTNGQAACQPCHDRKSSLEGHAAQGHRASGP